MTVIAQGQPLSRVERDKAAAELRASEKLLLAAVAGLSDAQERFKPSPERWSVLECVEHVALTEDSYWDTIRKLLESPTAPEKKAEVAGKDELVLRVMPDRTSRRVTAERLEPRGRWKTMDEVLAHFKRSRARLLAYAGTTTDDLRTHFASHRAVVGRVVMREGPSVVAATTTRVTVAASCLVDAGIDAEPVVSPRSADRDT